MAINRIEVFVSLLYIIHVGDAGRVFVVEVNTLNIRFFDAFRLYLVANHFHNSRYVLMDCL